MSRQTQRNRPSSPARDRRPATAPARAAQRRWTWWLGFIPLAAAIIASLLLVMEHLSGAYLPGCGPGSPCARATGSVWGKVPGLGWPVSFLGLAYFVALTIGWALARSGVSCELRWLVRIGLLPSVFFTVVMIVGGYVCPYCLAAHIGNFALWILVELIAPRGLASWRPVIATCAAFLLLTPVLGAIDFQNSARAQAIEERKAEESTRRVLADAQQPVPDPAATQPVATQPIGRAPVPAHAPAAPPPAPPVAAGVPDTGPTPAPSATAPAARKFTGRYRTGPERAPIRIVMFIDYQCLGCNMLEHELKPILESRDDISFSVKLWPGNRACNPYVPPGMEDSHVFSCGAARAAEAAGVVGGNEAFWKIHHWLFERSARYTEDELRAFVVELGLDVEEYLRVREGDLVRERIAADVEEGFSLGLASTPMVFVNGREFEGWAAPQAMTKLLEQAKSVNLPIRGPESDRPPPALEKFVKLFSVQRIREIPPPIRCWTLGPPDARWKIVAWGDYQQPYTVLADGVLRQIVAERDDVSYTFRPFPLHQGCNPGVEGVKHELSCRAAQAALAAGTLGGADAYWKMHAWLMENAENFSSQTLLAAIQRLGLDPGAFRQTMESPELNEDLIREAEAAQQVELKNSPIMFVNGRVVPRWMHGETPVLREVLLGHFEGPPPAGAGRGGAGR